MADGQQEQSMTHPTVQAPRRERRVVSSPKPEDFRVPEEEIRHFEAIREWGRRSAQANWVMGKNFVRG